ncbi:MAG: hypothetical protein LAO56_14780 [Acidobacteriia bacterium]|nr:hypothetical protein [Terriglobia bacterium]
MRYLLTSSFCGFAAASLLSSFIFAQNRHEAYIVLRNPPAVAVFDTTKWNQTATIPLESRPRVAQFDARSATLYIVAEELPAIPAGRDGQPTSNTNHFRLIVIDAVARQIRQNIPLGSGTSVDCSPTANRGRLLCVCYHASPDRTQVTVIDTEKNFESAAIKLDYRAHLAASNADASRVFLRQGAQRAQDQWVVHSFERRTESGASRYELAKSSQVRGLWDMVLSPEGSWLYVLALGADSDKTKHEDGARVLVVDPKELTVAAEFPVGNLGSVLTHHLGINPATGRALYIGGGDYTGGRFMEFNGASAPLTIETGPRPQRWYRVGDQQGIWITNMDQMRYLPAGGDGTSTRITLLGSSEKEIGIGGSPGPMIYLPRQSKGVMLITDREGNAQGKVALIDFRQQRVERVITTGKNSVGNTIANSLLALAGGLLAVGMNEPLGGGGEPQRHAQLVPTADGSLVYALNSVTNDVTVIRTADGVVLDRVRVCHCAVLSPAPGVRFIAAHSKVDGQDDELTWFDTRINKVKSQLKLSREKVRVTAAVATSNIFVVLTSRALLLWNSDNGELVHRTDNLSDPIGIFGTEIASITTLPTDPYDWFTISSFAVD